MQWWKKIGIAVIVLETGKARYETQWSGPRVNKMRHEVVWLDVIEIS